MVAATGLPPGKYSAALVGPWYPGSSAPLRGAATQWGSQATIEENAAQDLRQRSDAMSRNEGITADNYQQGLQSRITLHLDLADKYVVKQGAGNSAADAMDCLQSELDGIAAEYNQKLEAIESESTSQLANMISKRTRMELLITEAQGLSMTKSATAVANITSAIQKILDAEGMSMSAQEFMQSQGISTDSPVPPDPKKAVAEGLGDQGGEDNAPGGPGIGNGIQPGEDTPPVQQGGPLGDKAGVKLPAEPQQVPGGVMGLPGRAGVPTSGGGGSASTPGAPSVSAPSVGSPVGLSPESLGQSFSQGAASGAPAASGAQALSSGTFQAVDSAVHPAPQAGAPASTGFSGGSVAPVVSGGGGDGAGAGAGAGSEHGGQGSAVQPVGAAPVVAAPVAPVSPAAPAVPGGVQAPAGPAGPLPAYGSDLRPPTVAAPPVSAAAQGPVSGAPVPPSAQTSATAGGAGSGLVSPVDRGSTTSVGQGSGAAAGAAAAAAAGSGAAAGDAARRSVERSRLERVVASLARQEPRLAWAAGVCDGGLLTLVATDLAGGWIPGHIALPQGVSLLPPAARRQDVSALDLLGTVEIAAAHEPHGYVAVAGPDDPVLTGESARFGAKVDELGPTLVELVQRLDGFPRQVLTAARSAGRGGIAVDERQYLAGISAGVRDEVLAAYPQHGRPDVLRWIVIAAVEALVDGSAELAAYHAAWALAVRDGWAKLAS